MDDVSNAIAALELLRKSGKPVSMFIVAMNDEESFSIISAKGRDQIVMAGVVAVKSAEFINQLGANLEKVSDSNMPGLRSFGPRGEA